MSLFSSLSCRLRQPVFLWALLALTTELAVEYLGSGPQHWPLYLTLLPIIPMLFFVASLMRAVRRMDELQRQICLQSAYLAFLLTIVATLIFAGLDRSHIYIAKWDDVGTVMLFLFGCSYVFFSWRYR
jgi:hypothetical protein